MTREIYEDDSLRRILTQTKTIAIVGLSNNPTRASHHVGDFLTRQTYQTYGINPGLAGQKVAGMQVYASLKDVPVAIDMVDVFRNSDDAAQVVADALALNPLPKVIWMQLGVINLEAAAQARAKGIEVIMDRCPAIEIPRLKLRRI
ncbi:MAG: CoA-binding protein [Alphaproteobacteria bacterium]|nr:CoA-binding protein [Alphaproteobacteria bacterium]